MYEETGLGKLEKIIRCNKAYKVELVHSEANHPELEYSCYLLVFSFLALKYVTSKIFVVQD